MSDAPETLTSPRLLWTTIGAFALIFLGAFEALAVTTVMPIVAKDLDGEGLYSVAFASTLAASVVGTVIAGGWADRRGPSRPLVAAMSVFVVGLLVSGFATDMGVFIVGRFLQGFGSGAVNVCLYVVVARIYPAALHPKVFAVFAAAWVLPSLVGPPLAGLVAIHISWHWVFLGVGVLVVLAAGTILPAIRDLWRNDVATGVPGNLVSVIWAVVVAAGVVAISLAAEVAGEFAWLVAAIAVVVVVLAIRPLIPAGTLLVRRGLPATIFLRGAVAASFFATEIYLPYQLIEVYGLRADVAGFILSVGAISWAIGSAVQGKLDERMSHATLLRYGTALLLVGILVQLVSAALVLSPFVAAFGWLLAGGGMGLVFPRISTLVLAFSTPRDQGFNSAAMTNMDTTASATAVAFAGLVFVALGNSFAAVMALTTVFAIVAVIVAARTTPRT
ncbi:MAG: MFS transporter [Microbacteriaceae bacterium]